MPGATTTRPSTSQALLPSSCACGRPDLSAICRSAAESVLTLGVAVAVSLASLWGHAGSELISWRSSETKPFSSTLPPSKLLLAVGGLLVAVAGTELVPEPEPVPEPVPVAVAVGLVEAVEAMEQVKAVEVAVAVVAAQLAGAAFWNEAGGRMT